MLGWLLSGPKVTSMAGAIHEMACHAHHARELGSPLHSYFIRHPMLRTHRPPTPGDHDQVHSFWITDGRQGFSVMIREGGADGGAWLSVAPDGDFDGAHVRSGKKGRYLVHFDRPLARPPGRLATKLIEKFVTAYGAMDVSV